MVYWACTRRRSCSSRCRPLFTRRTSRLDQVASEKSRGLAKFLSSGEAATPSNTFLFETRDWLTKARSRTEAAVNLEDARSPVLGASVFSTSADMILKRFSAEVLVLVSRVSRCVGRLMTERYERLHSRGGWMMAAKEEPPREPWREPKHLF